MSRHDRPDRPELLAPAGDWEAMRAAVANGADAVYFGLSNFNARYRAANFTLQELPDVMAYLHHHNVRGFVTFNTLIFSDELPEAVRFIQAIVQAGVDAVIVQDLGIARLIQELCPDLAVHGSTQMTLTEPRGIEMVAKLGVQRVVLARELSIDHISSITQATDMPVEVFVHGALCVSYSGQCLTSESLGGRSANRGQCAQACRLPYELVVDGQVRDLGEKAYLLSPQDLAAHDLIDKLVEKGVISFKIEGRLKSAHYVAMTTQTYRSALDMAMEHKPFSLTPAQQQDLSQSFSRGFTHGFLSGVDHQTLVHGRFPKSRGVKAGVVVGYTDRGLIIEPTDGHLGIVKPGDGVVFDEGHPEQDEQGGRLFEVFPLGKRNGQARLELVLGRGDVNLQAVSIGSTVWKTDDPALRKRLEQTYKRERVVSRLPLSFVVNACVGEPLEMIVSDPNGNQISLTSEQPLAAAMKHPLTEETLREQLGRLGDTPFELGNVTYRCESSIGVMAPRSVLNDMRRKAVEAIIEKRNSRKQAIVSAPHALEKLRTHAQQVSRRAAPGPRLYVMTRTLDQVHAVCQWQPTGDIAALKPAMIYCDFEDIRQYKQAVEIARSAGMTIGIATTRIVLPGEEGFLNVIGQAEPDAILVRNLAGISFFREKYPQLQLMGDYALNAANEITAAFYAELGLQRLVPSYDLNWKQLEAMLSRINPALFEMVIHQHMPMFHMEHCVFAHTLSNGKDYRDCGRPCEKHQVDLKDRAGAAHALIPDVGCRNTVYNALAQSAAECIPQMLAMGMRHFRVELLRHDADQIPPLLERYARVLAGLDDGRTTWRQLRVLNQLGVTRGTLERV